MANKKPKRLADLLPPEAFDEAFKQFDEELRHAQAELGTPKNTLAWFLQFAEKDLKKLSPSQRNIEISHLMASALGDKPDSGKGKFTGREEIWDSRDPR